jgi:hypothetical protein
MMVDVVDVPESPDTPADVSAAPQAFAAPVAQPAAPATQAPASAASPEQIQQIVETTRDIFNRAAQPPRWPMYVRQFKQFIRAVDSTFDERKWGFATVMEFLRVCQREGVLRLERDRRGQIRVFPGAALQSPVAMAPSSSSEPRSEDIRDVADVPVVDAEPVAEPDGQLLGRESLGEGGQPDLDAEIAAEAPVAEVIEIDEQPAPVKTRRPRKTSTAGKPAARKSTGVRTSARRRKAPAA